MTDDRIAAIGRIAMLASASEENGEPYLEVTTTDARALLDERRDLAEKLAAATRTVAALAVQRNAYAAADQDQRALIASQAETIRKWHAAVQEPDAEAERIERDLKAARDIFRRPDDQPRYPVANWLIWSHEHAAWWKPFELGYTDDLAEAGRYLHPRAYQICREANAYGGWLNGLPNEVMIEWTGDPQAAAAAVRKATDALIAERGERHERHFSPGYQGEKPDHHGPSATCAMPACVKSRARHEAVADLQDLTYELFADPDTKQDPADD